MVALLLSTPLFGGTGGGGGSAFLFVVVVLVVVVVVVGTAGGTARGAAVLTRFFATFKTGASFVLGSSTGSCFVIGALATGASTGSFLITGAFTADGTTETFFKTGAEYFWYNSPILAFRREMGMRLIRRSIRARKSAHCRA